jgi:hypothetical protein
MTIHYKPAGSRTWPTCLNTKRKGALTLAEWHKLPLTGVTSTNVYKVTCNACLKQIALEIYQRIGDKYEPLN